MFLKRRVELVHRLAVPAAEGRLVVPGVDLAGTAVDEDPDDALGLGGEVRRPRGHRVQGKIGAALISPRPALKRPLAVDQSGQTQEAAAAAGLGKPVAAREGALRTCGLRQPQASVSSSVFLMDRIRGHRSLRLCSKGPGRSRQAPSGWSRAAGLGVALGCGGEEIRRQLGFARGRLAA